MRATRQRGGFSLIELMVTIFIAGVVFAAMVPLVLNAGSANTNDARRNTAASIAQDKIERVRQLDYREIAANPANQAADQTTANLYDPAFKSGQFGPTAQPDGAGTKVYDVDYTVVSVPTNAGALVEQYKEVTIVVGWEAGGSTRAGSVTLVTRVYRQFAGPNTTLGISPQLNSAGAIVDPNEIVLIATVPVDWITDTAKVSFRITLDEVVMGSQDVLISDTILHTNAAGDTYKYLGNGAYQFTWKGAAIALAGLYKFTAVGYDHETGSAGDERGLYANLVYTRADPPTGLTASPGVEQVFLSWNACTNPLFDHFEIWQSTVADQAGTMVATTVANNYVRTGLTAGTKYYFSLRVVTTTPATSLASNFMDTSVVPNLTWLIPLAPQLPDTQAPSVSVLTVAVVAGQPKLNLSWTVSVDSPPPTPPSGLDHYAIYRSATSATTGFVLLTYMPKTATTYPDATVGYSKTMWYKIEAWDAAPAPNHSTSTVKSATSSALPTYDLTVANGPTADAKGVWVQNMDTLLYYTKAGVGTTTYPAGVAIRKNVTNTKWVGLPAGTYNVYANFTANTFVTSPVWQADITTGNNTITINKP